MWQGIYRPDGKVREAAVEGACVLAPRIPIRKSHCNRCGCKPSLTGIESLEQGRDKVERKVIEAFFVIKKVRKRGSARPHCLNHATSLNICRCHSDGKEVPCCTCCIVFPFSIWGTFFMCYVFIGSGLFVYYLACFFSTKTHLEVVVLYS